MPTINETIEKVRQFASLPEGWCFGEAGPISNESVSYAFAFLAAGRAFGLERANAFPGASGQVQITFYVNLRMLELTIETDQSITLAEDYENEQIDFIEDVSLSGAYLRLREFAECASLDLFTEDITIQNAADFRAKPLISLGNALFQLWTKIVRSKQAEQSAPTLPGITENRPESQSSIGALRTMLFPITASTNENEQNRVTIAIATSIGT